MNSTNDQIKNLTATDGKPPVSGSASRKPNPYELVWYKQGWSKTRTEKNNAKYWQFEIEHNGLRLP